MILRGLSRMCGPRRVGSDNEVTPGRTIDRQHVQHRERTILLPAVAVTALVCGPSRAATVLLPPQANREGDAAWETKRTGPSGHSIVLLTSPTPRRAHRFPAPNVLPNAPQDFLLRRILLIKAGTRSTNLCQAEGATPIRAPYSSIPYPMNQITK
jgi:hypothetical protein